MLQCPQDTIQAIAGQLIRVAHPGAQVAVGTHQGRKEPVHSAHRRDGVLRPFQRRYNRLGGIARGQCVIAFAGALLLPMLVQARTRQVQVRGRYPQLLGVLVEQVTGMLVVPRIAG